MFTPSCSGLLLLAILLLPFAPSPLRLLASPSSSPRPLVLSFPCSPRLEARKCGCLLMVTTWRDPWFRFSSSFYSFSFIFFVFPFISSYYSCFFFFFYYSFITSTSYSSTTTSGAAGQRSRVSLPPLPPPPPPPFPAPPTLFLPSSPEAKPHHVCPARPEVTGARRL